ncbi:MAG: hypothetical protein DMD61_06280 [Gemmatimonadetes bacterium]|nr:MAG: hypothetical protein DMD61_06280 [Gemmatimonadota bacterium]
MRPAHRTRQRAGRAGQHHGGDRALRRRRAAPGRGERGGRAPRVPIDRHRDQHGAGPRLSGQPPTRARGAQPLARDRPARGCRRGGAGALPVQPDLVTAQFKFLSGARAGQVEWFRKAYIGLGRHPLSDVRFDAERDLDVSARHAGIVRQGETFVVRDLGSTNGTFVNGTRITGEVVLADGNVISFGQNGPAVEFHILAGEPYPEADGGPAPARRSSTTVRIAAEVARQTRQLRRTTTLLIGVLVLALTAFAWTQWRSTNDGARMATCGPSRDSAPSSRPPSRASAAWPAWRRWTTAPSPSVTRAPWPWWWSSSRTPRSSAGRRSPPTLKAR